jgi:hypothetical protein
MQAVGVAKALGNSVGLRTHSAKQLPKKAFFDAIRTGKPFVRYGGPLKAWAGELAFDSIEDFVQQWQGLTADPPSWFDQSLLDPDDAPALAPSTA